MKKFLSVLLAVAMVATALFAVFTPAGAADDTVPAYTAELNSNDVRSGVKLTDTLAVGDVLSFYVKVVPGDGQDLETIMGALKLYVRGNTKSSNIALYIKDGKVTSNQAYGSKLKDNAIDCGDGWYYVEVSIPAADSYFLNLNAEDVSGATLGEGCMYADICVEGTPVTTVLGYVTGDALVATQITEPTIPSPEPTATPSVEPTATPSENPTATPSEEPTDDETEDVEPTGAISAAVVAIAAVIGGAVVLKKREI